MLVWQMSVGGGVSCAEGGGEIRDGYGSKERERVEGKGMKV